MKTCTICKTEQSEDEFAFRSKVNGTRRAQCKSCVKDMDAKRYQNPTKAEAVRLNSSSRRQWLTNMVWSYKQGQKCADCPQTDPRTFEFDHLPVNQKFMNVSQMVHNSYAWEKILQEIGKCEIVCASCHAIRTFERAGRRRDIVILA